MADVVLGIVSTAIGGAYGLFYFYTDGADEVHPADEHIVRVAAPVLAGLPFWISIPVGVHNARACRRASE